MPLTTRQPTSNTTPAPGVGGDFVAGPTNTGHGTTSGSGNYSASWVCSGFANVSGQKTSVRLKANHSSNGFVSGAAFNSYIIEYSLNGGSSWTTAFTRAFFNTLLNSSFDIALPNNQDLTQVQVRDRGLTSITDPELENAAIDFSVSSIRIEVTTVDTTKPILIM